MPISTTPPLRLARDIVLHLRPDLSLQPVPVGPGYWDHKAEQPELAEGSILSVFEYDEASNWTWWERHPVGDELVFVLSGRVTFWVEDADGCRHLELGEGECGIIPEGAWHRAEVQERIRLLFVTPTPARTELREA